MHIPIMVNEIIKYFNIKKNGIYIDCTFGCGGHSKIILSKLDKDSKLISIDKDNRSKYFSSLIKDNRFLFINDNYSSIKKYLLKLNILGKVNSILLDLGISSFQINDNNRGFSFMNNGYLDMRINDRNGFTASEWINNESEKNISKILYTYGEEKNSKKIARNIVKERKYKYIKNTFDLKNIILKSIKNINYKKKIKSLARCFQAIRIYINNELNELKNTLKIIPEILKKNGVLLILTFHSIEDRIVKNFFKKDTFLNKIPLIDIEERKIIKEKFNMIQIKKIKPSNKEIKTNPKSRNTILRIFEKKIY